MTQSTRKARKKLSPIESFKKIFYSKINIFLFFVPVGYIVHFLSLNAILVFTINSLAIISLGYRLNELTYYFEEPIIRNIIDVLFRNLIELIITIITLVNGQIQLVQSVVLGSLFFNILLVLGLCFLVGGVKILKKEKLEQDFSSTIAQTITGVLTLSCISLVLPAAFSVFVQKSYDMLYTHDKLFILSHEGEEYIDTITSLVLLAMMAVIIVFSAIFLIKSIDGIVGLSKPFIGLILLPIVCHIAKFITIAFVDIKYIEFEVCDECRKKMKATKYENNTECDECKKIKPTIREKRMKATTILSSKSSIRTALLTTPLLVILGWIISKPMSLSFSPFETICVVIAIILKNYLVQMGNQIG
ncbi:15964_t:CDS:2 [Dentiscutata heterogama]|uniref:15964_t:CDS:1 n=1 Tax=Dentiscutata heterogama TaxID=1316150 RepID=A0ACA9JZ86_9GLOM|nr:15964_t:CDS:2 [Dentiscutata heterogama]